MPNMQAEGAEETLFQLVNDKLVTSPQCIPDAFKSLAADQLERFRLRCSEALLLNEALWIDWLSDWQDMDADTLLGLHSLSVQHGKSPKLWLMFLDFLDFNANELSSCTPGDIDTMYENAVNSTAFLIDSSQSIWIRYWRRLLDKASDDPEPEEVKQLEEVFMLRLSQPHLTLGETFSDFSSFVTKYDNSNYEDLLSRASITFAIAKKALMERQDHERMLKQTDGSLQAYLAYLTWQCEQPLKSDYFVHLGIALLERSLNAHPYDARIWEQGIVLYQKLSSSCDLDTQLSFAQRAVAMCPSYALFWGFLAKCIAQSSRAGGDTTNKIWQAFDNALSIRAIRSSLNEFNELVSAAYLALRHCEAEETPVPRRPVRLLEVACKKVSKIGHDQGFLLHRLLISEYTRQGKVELASKIWKSLARTHSSPSSSAFTVLKSGSLEAQDAPQLLHDALLCHALESGSVEAFAKASAVVKKANSLLAVNLRADSERVAASNDELASVRTIDKRKASSEDISQEAPFKKHKLDVDNNKRHREFKTIIVQTFVPAIDQSRLRELTKEMGEIIDIKTLTNDDRGLFYLEYDREIAEKYLGPILTQGGSVTSASGTALFVTNFPPTFNSDALANIFGDVGPVLDVRLPSLAYNQSRRFAYVQMTSQADATSALSKDGMSIDGVTLSVQISDPSKRTSRQNKTRHELFVKGVSWSATMDDVKQLFERHGEVEQVRMPSTFSTKHHDGIAFVAFKEAEGATAALALNGHEFHGRALEVQHATSQRDSSTGRKNDRSRAKQKSMKAIALLNLADTVNKIYLAEVCTQYGTVHHVELRPDHGGAIIEFVDAASAGKAALALEGRVFDNKAVHVGQVSELLQTSNPQHHDKTVMLPSSIGRRKKPLVAVRPLQSLGTSLELASHARDQPSAKTKGQDYFRELMEKKS
ncbi:hypothetical protein BCR37DRAFT_391518 [Protomyces lactucae-debilis]|uniref:RRM domain-containing protein n=1 Tax=Protomyces lactucae-debilis TaxID=2754530 RepID=A0A1Y2FP27_PROLT|nr:uncharacterized protein BCR37DRAFT_391518 [Protomyces lactucae-debilis]ORY85762.1 hypothetical protein BCR37DRAFT_391518 [Protomyces lactucae-debilis]